MGDGAEGSDIVAHNDILSSPSKRVACGLVRSNGSAQQTPIKDLQRKKREVSRKALLEKIQKAAKREEEGEKGKEDHIELRNEKRRRLVSPCKRKETVLSDQLEDSPLVYQGDLVTEAKPEALEPARSPDFPRLPSEPDLEVDVELTDPLSTPSKKAAISKTFDHDFTSPLKKVILDNLQEYKDTASSQSLKLSRNFTPTPLPTNQERFRQHSEKSVSSFFDTYEGYFDQRKAVRGSKKSKNTMSMATELTREEFALISNVFHSYLHRKARSELFEIQKKMFPQFWLELLQGFSLLFYGMGSKREFIEKFAFEYLVPRLAYSQMEKHREANPETSLDVNDYNIPCIVINGYNPTCNYRDVFKDISAAILPEELSRNETKYWGNHVLLHIQKMIEIYKNEPPDIKVVIIVHNLDGPSLRKDSFQTMLCYLALIRQVAIVGSTDHIYAPILWDNFKAQNYNFVFHDITNYEPFTVESSFRDVMRMGKNDSASGAEGARYVLESLTINSKKMYKLLVETQINNMEKSSNTKGKVAPTKRGIPTVGIEFKQFLHLCAAEFIASNELSLRSMLTEFVEHKMASISKNPAGTEHVWVPYNYSEMTKLLAGALKEI
ncbi:hypothetical protein HG536_0C03430 [Torulaspora globosa]|uniref:Origin recognition complex subunit 2 n=1 Tax=Torulaspora globosa TaxID=48254 RepID=A0A7G3ZF89_9SACH|nr:uncharacterized protein HG536_0C03430 [Torulaspora globosa]QLL32175.1 hypothetical protein HG536_0C03430 [Torulaspora globosa]